MSNFNKLYQQFTALIDIHCFEYGKFNEYAIVHHSNAIEGVTLTEDETYLLLNDEITPNSKPLHYTLMAVDQLKALKFVVSSAERKDLIASKKYKILARLYWLRECY